MIKKTWNQLIEKEKEDVIRYIESCNDNVFNRSRETQIRAIEGMTYGNGDHYFVFFEGDMIIGTVGVILKEVAPQGIAYINELRGTQSAELRKHLVDFAKEMCIKSGAKEVKLGLLERHDEFIPQLVESGFIYVHSLVELKKCKREIYEDAVAIDLLTLEYAEAFATIMTEAFKDSPNGATVTVEDAKKQAEENDLCGVISVGSTAVGAFELTLKDEIGWIDTLAVAPSNQNKGYGRLLFRSVQNYLWERGAKELKMCVFDTNKIAFDLYLKHGFTRGQLLSKWYSLQPN